MSEPLKIKKAENESKPYTTFSIRIKNSTIERLDDLADQTNKSRNKLIQLILDYGLDNIQLE